MFRHIAALVAAVALSCSTVACMAPTESEAEAAESADQDLVAKSAKFDVFQGEDGDFYFRFVAANGEVLVRSEGYTTRQSADKGIASVMANAPDTRNVEILEATNGSFYFVVKAQNHEIIATSEMYSTKWSAERGARTVRALTRQMRAGE